MEFRYSIEQNTAAGTVDVFPTIGGNVRRGVCIARFPYGSGGHPTGYAFIDSDEAFRSAILFTRALDLDAMGAPIGEGIDAED